jgi:hypothetical protein
LLGIEHPILLAPMGFTQEAQALVEIGDVDAHGFADQLHEIREFERNLGLKLDELAVAAVEDRGEGRDPDGGDPRSRSVT